MTSSAASFGAPVTEPGGKVAPSRSVQPASGRRSPRTVETRCTRPGCCSTAQRAGTVTDPVAQTRPRSLRTRSTIITFSARSLSCRSALPRPVPLIGPDSTTRPDRGAGTARARRWRRACLPSGSRRTPAYGAGLPAASRAARPATFGPIGVGQRRGQDAAEVGLVDLAGRRSGSGSPRRRPRSRPGPASWSSPPGAARPRAPAAACRIGHRRTWRRSARLRRWPGRPRTRPSRGRRDRR